MVYRAIPIQAPAICLSYAVVWLPTPLSCFKESGCFQKALTSAYKVAYICSYFFANCVFLFPSDMLSKLEIRIKSFELST